jgi:hypothetical protein
MTIEAHGRTAIEEAPGASGVSEGTHRLASTSSQVAAPGATGEQRQDGDAARGPIALPVLFECVRIPARLTRNACGRKWAAGDAAKNLPASSAERMTHAQCIGCTIGEAHHAKQTPETWPDGAPIVLRDPLPSRPPAQPIPPAPVRKRALRAVPSLPALPVEEAKPVATPALGPDTFPSWASDDESRAALVELRARLAANPPKPKHAQPVETMRLAVDLDAKHGRGVVADALGLDPSTLRRWARLLGDDSDRGLTDDDRKVIALYFGEANRRGAVAMELAGRGGPRSSRASLAKAWSKFVERPSVRAEIERLKADGSAALADRDVKPSNVIDEQRAPVAASPSDLAAAVDAAVRARLDEIHARAAETGEPAFLGEPILEEDDPDVAPAPDYDVDSLPRLEEMLRASGVAVELLGPVPRGIALLLVSHLHHQAQDVRDVVRALGFACVVAGLLPRGAVIVASHAEEAAR